MPDVPNIPVVPAAPATTTPQSMGAAVGKAATAANNAPEPKGSAKSSVPGSGEPAPKADGSVVAKSPAEKEVIRKIKVGDKDYDENILRGLIEKAEGADKKFLEAAQAKKEAYRFFRMAKENPTEFLRKTGLDPKKYAYDQVAEDIKNTLRDPKEVELEAAQKRLAEYEAKEKAEKDRLTAEEQTKKAKAWETKLNQEIIEALEGAPSLPKNGHTVAKMAKYMAMVHAKTGVLLSPKEVVGVIEQDTRREIAGIVKGATAEQLLQLVGEEGLAALRAYDLARLKNPLKDGNGSSTTETTVTDGTRAPKRRWRNSHEYWRSIDQAAKAERDANGGR